MDALTDTRTQPNKKWMTRQRRFAFLLIVPFSLFLMRVAIQFLQLQAPVSWLPPFASWQSGALPYPWLLASQMMILALMSYVVWRLGQGNIQQNRWLGHIWLRVGVIYFFFMLLRLITGLTVFSGIHWFGSPIPALFHLILASFLILLGKLHLW